jgi:hypothetical protein
MAYSSQAEWYKACNRGDWLIWQLRRLPDDKLTAIMPGLLRALDTIVQRAIYRTLYRLRYTDASEIDAWVAWAECWLSGEDRTVRAAYADAAHAAFAYAAYAAADADAAAAAADSADSAAAYAAAAAHAAAAYAADAAAAAAADAAAYAAYAAYAAAYAASDAEYRAQAEDIHREIPEWPGE